MPHDPDTRPMEPPGSTANPSVLRLIVFVCGMSTMAIEMSASRLLAPYFGTSLFVWTNIIGLIMVALSLGYWLGGRIADRHPRARVLCTIVLAAGVCCGTIPFVARPLLGWTVGGESVGIFIGSFTGTLLLFVPPVFFLGMVSPFAIRLAARQVGAMGQVSGSIYALSTVGSIVGTFLPALVTIPLMGTTRTILLFAALLAGAGALGLTSMRLREAPLVLIAAVLLAAIPAAGGGVRPGAGVIFETESIYNYIQVKQVRSGAPPEPIYTRNLLVLNEGYAVHSVHYLEPRPPFYPLVSNVWDYMTAVPFVARLEGQRLDLCMVGLAAGTVTKAIHHFLSPHLTLAMDGVEIDPAIIEVGRRHFEMSEPTLAVHAADGRQFLARTRRRYDVVMTDAYKQPYIPFHLTTREYFELVAGRLKPGGIAAINVGATSPRERVLRMIVSTVRSVFPHVYSVQVRNPEAGFDNHVVIAARRKIAREEFLPQVNPLAAKVGAANPSVPILGILWHWSTHMKEEYPGGPEGVLTDDLAPVELLTDTMILRYLASPDMVVPRI